MRLRALIFSLTYDDKWDLNGIPSGFHRSQSGEIMIVKGKSIVSSEGQILCLLVGKKKKEKKKKPNLPITESKKKQLLQKRNGQTDCEDYTILRTFTNLYVSST